MVLLFRSNEAVQAENLFMRRQLALYIERGVQPRRIDAASRVSLALWSKLFDWRGALVVVQPATMIRWHRAGWRLLWRMKSRPGRPPIPKGLRALIRRIANENRLWGEERIANEPLLKLGIRISPRTVRKYMPKRAPVLCDNVSSHNTERVDDFLAEHRNVHSHFTPTYSFISVKGSRASSATS